MINQNESQLALLADELTGAADAVRQAIEHYREVAAMSGALEPTELAYKQPTAGLDLKQYRIESVNALWPYRNDGVLQSAAGAEDPHVEMVLLSASPHWQDRIRARALQLDSAQAITLPSGFPCIYEPADSPRNNRGLNPHPFIWVASPDEAMLHELLPLYRELWESYENQWPNTPNRTFEVGRLDDVSPTRVFRPGATPVHIIGSTMLTHADMYHRAPEHLKAMHPRHDQWTKSRKEIAS